MEDRSKYYREPMKLGAATLYESDIITNINNGHWEAFHNANKEEGFKIGDFIDVAVQLTAKQLVDFLDDMKKLHTITEVYEYADEKILEISKEIKLK